MSSNVRARLWLETALATLSGFLAVLMLLNREWIEALTGVDPDHHDGSLEWAIVAGLVLLCAALAVVARAEWRRPAGSG
jgi:hypothetical protein